MSGDIPSSRKLKLNHVKKKVEPTTSAQPLKKQSHLSTRSLGETDTVDGQERDNLPTDFLKPNIFVSFHPVLPKTIVTSSRLLIGSKDLLYAYKLLQNNSFLDNRKELSETQSAKKNLVNEVNDLNEGSVHRTFKEVHQNQDFNVVQNGPQDYPLSSLKKQKKTGHIGSSNFSKESTAVSAKLAKETKHSDDDNQRTNNSLTPKNINEISVQNSVDCLRNGTILSSSSRAKFWKLSASVKNDESRLMRYQNESLGYCAAQNSSKKAKERDLIDKGKGNDFAKAKNAHPVPVANKSFHFTNQKNISEIEQKAGFSKKTTKSDMVNATDIIVNNKVCQSLNKLPEVTHTEQCTTQKGLQETEDAVSRNGSSSASLTNSEETSYEHRFEHSIGQANKELCITLCSGRRSKKVHVKETPSESSAFLENCKISKIQSFKKMCHAKNAQRNATSNQLYLTIVPDKSSSQTADAEASISPLKIPKNTSKACFRREKHVEGQKFSHDNEKFCISPDLSDSSHLDFKDNTVIQDNELIPSHGKEDNRVCPKFNGMLLNTTTIPANMPATTFPVDNLENHLANCTVKGVTMNSCVKKNIDSSTSFKLSEADDICISNEHSIATKYVRVPNELTSFTEHEARDISQNVSSKCSETACCNGNDPIISCSSARSSSSCNKFNRNIEKDSSYKEHGRHPIGGKSPIMPYPQINNSSQEANTPDDYVFQNQTSSAEACELSHHSPCKNPTDSKAFSEKIERKLNHNVDFLIPSDLSDSDRLDFEDDSTFIQDSEAVADYEKKNSPVCSKFSGPPMNKTIPENTAATDFPVDNLENHFGDCIVKDINVNSSAETSAFSKPGVAHNCNSAEHDEACDFCQSNDPPASCTEKNISNCNKPIASCSSAQSSRFYNKFNRYYERDSSDSDISDKEDECRPVYSSSFMMPYCQQNNRSRETKKSNTDDHVFKKPFVRVRKYIRSPNRKRSSPKPETHSADELMIHPTLSDLELDSEETDANKRPRWSNEALSVSSNQIQEGTEQRSDSSAEKIALKQNTDSSAEKIALKQNTESSERYTTKLVKEKKNKVKINHVNWRNPVKSMENGLSVSAVPKKRKDERPKNAISSPVVSIFSQMMEKIKEDCDRGHLRNAFHLSVALLKKRPPTDLKNQIVDRLLGTALQRSDVSCMQEIFQEIFQKVETLSNKHYSNFILACNTKPKLTYHAAVDVFYTCDLKNIRLTDDAVTALTDIFKLEGTFSATLRLILYKRKVCHYTNVDYQQLQYVLHTCVYNTKTLKEDTKLVTDLLLSILKTLTHSELHEFPTATLQSFVDLLKEKTYQPNSYLDIERYIFARLGPTPFSQRKEVRPSSAVTHMTILSKEASRHPQQLPNPMPSVSLPEKINSWVEHDDWKEVANIFKSCIAQRNYDLISHIHFSIFLKGDIFRRFSRFVATVTDNIPIKRKPCEQLPNIERFFLSQIGCALMRDTYENKDVITSYSLLRLLHAYRINYFQLQQAVYKDETMSAVSSIHSLFMPPWDIILAAFDACLCNNKPTDALEIISEFHDRLLDDSVSIENSTKIVRERVNLLIKLASMLLKQNHSLDSCQRALNFLVSFMEGKLRNVVSEKDLRSIKRIFNTYLAKCLNSHNVVNAKQLLGAVRHMDLFADIEHVILRGFVVQYFNIGQVEEARDLFKTCCQGGMYSIPLPDVTVQPREMHLASHWTHVELKIILEEKLRMFYDLLSNKNKTCSFEDWFSLTFKFVTPPAITESLPNVVGITKTSTNFEDFSNRLINVLGDMGIAAKPDGIDSVKVDPTSIYEMFSQKNVSTKESLPQVSNVIKNLTWNKQNEHAFGKNDISSKKSNRADSSTSEDKALKCVERRLSGGIMPNMKANLAPQLSSPITPRDRPPLPKKLRLSNSMCSRKYDLDKAKTSGLCISFNSSGREIMPKESNAKSGALFTSSGPVQKHVHATHVKSSSPTEKSSPGRKRLHSPVFKDLKYEWKRQDASKSQSSERNSAECRSSPGRSSSPLIGGQKLHPTVPGSSKSVGTGRDFRNKVTPPEQAIVTSHESQISPTPIQLENKRLKPSRIHLQPTYSPRPTVATVNSLSSGNCSVRSTSDIKLKEAVVILVNQKRPKMVPFEKTKLVDELLENFLNQHKGQKTDFSSKKIKIELVKFVTAQLNS